MATRFPGNCPLFPYKRQLLVHWWCAGRNPLSLNPFGLTLNAFGSPDTRGSSTSVIIVSPSFAASSSFLYFAFIHSKMEFKMVWQITMVATKASYENKQENVFQPSKIGHRCGKNSAGKSLYLDGPTFITRASGLSLKKSNWSGTFFCRALWRGFPMKPCRTTIPFLLRTQKWLTHPLWVSHFCLKMNKYKRGLDSLKLKLLSNHDGGGALGIQACVCVASASLVSPESCWCDEWNLYRWQVLTSLTLRTSPGDHDFN